MNKTTLIILEKLLTFSNVKKSNRERISEYVQSFDEHILKIMKTRGWGMKIFKEMISFTCDKISYLHQGKFDLYTDTEIMRQISVALNLTGNDSLYLGEALFCMIKSLDELFVPGTSSGVLNNFLKNLCINFISEVSDKVIKDNDIEVVKREIIYSSNIDPKNKPLINHFIVATLIPYLYIKANLDDGMRKLVTNYLFNHLQNDSAVVYVWKMIKEKNYDSLYEIADNELEQFEDTVQDMHETFIEKGDKSQVKDLYEYDKGNNLVLIYQMFVTKLRDLDTNEREKINKYIGYNAESMKKVSIPKRRVMFYSKFKKFFSFVENKEGFIDYIFGDKKLSNLQDFIQNKIQEPQKETTKTNVSPFLNYKKAETLDHIYLVFKTKVEKLNPRIKNKIYKLLKYDPEKNKGRDFRRKFMKFFDKIENKESFIEYIFSSDKFEEIEDFIQK